MQTFIAFPGSQHLNDTTASFIDIMAGTPNSHEVPMLKDIMSHFTSEALHAFFKVPAEQLELNGAMMKIVNATISTIRSSSNLIVSRTAPKLNLKQIQNLAAYMDIMRIKAPNEQGDEVWHVSFPLKSSLAKKAQQGLEHLSGKQYEEAREAFTQFLSDMTDDGLFWYMEQPISMLGLGPILSALCKTGTETARKASKTVITKVIKRQEADGLEKVGGFIANLIIEREPRLPEQHVG